MPGKRINPEKAMSNAERQKRYREKCREELSSIKTSANVGIVEAHNFMRDEIKRELQETWEPELKEARISAERRKGRELAKSADQNKKHGRIIGICEAACFFIGKERIDITQALLTHFCIDRETAIKALEADKRTKSLTLTSLDKSGAWDKK